MPLTRAQQQGRLRQNISSQPVQANRLRSRQNELEPSLPVDPNPRGPKRRRVSSPKDEHIPIESSTSPINKVNGSTSSKSKSVNGANLQSNGTGQLSRSTSPVSENFHDSERSEENGISTATPIATTAPSPSAGSDRTRMESLPVLENLALQILSLLARVTHTEAQLLVRSSDSPNGNEYATLRSLFEHTKRLYTTRSPFLVPSELGLQEPKQVDMLRKANQAIFMSSIFTGEIGLRDMDRNFLDVFVSENGRLLKAQGSIFLELKTQAFMTAMRTAAAAPTAVMADLFPPDMDRILLIKRPGAKSLAPSEQDFLKRLSSRREILQKSITDHLLDRLPQRYKWDDFSREVSSYLAKNFEDLDSSTTSQVPVNLSGKTAIPTKLKQDQMQGQFSIHSSIPLDDPKAEQVLTNPTRQASVPVQMFSLPDDFVAQAARAAEIAMQGPADLAYKASEVRKPTSPTPTPLRQNTPTTSHRVQPQFQHYNPASMASNPGLEKSAHGGTGTEIPHSSQTAPTQVLYERARLAATAKSSPIPAKKAHSPSQRRPWTTEEENALMTGLDQVKGPHWSQILAMFGPGGTVNESLKDRNQVQLKDKARNLKLFFLKSGIEVPYYLKYVTGDLKTRAPTQASKQEARERERMQGEEAKAHLDGIQGIMALAANSQHLQSRSQSNITSSQSSQPNSPLIINGSKSESTEMRTFKPDSGRSDVDAMIARAAARATQSLEIPPWSTS